MKRISLEDLKNELKAFIESYFEECVAKYEDGHDTALMLHWFEETYMEKHMADMALDQVTFRIFLRKVLHNFYTKKEVDKKLNDQKWDLIDFINESILTVLPYKNENGELMTDKPIEELVGRVLYDFKDGVFTQYRDDAEGNIFNYVLSKEELRDFQIVFMENMPTLEESIYYMKDEKLIPLRHQPIDEDAVENNVAVFNNAGSTVDSGKKIGGDEFGEREQMPVVEVIGIGNYGSEKDKVYGYCVPYRNDEFSYINDAIVYEDKDCTIAIGQIRHSAPYNLQYFNTKGDVNSGLSNTYAGAVKSGNTPVHYLYGEREIVPNVIATEKGVENYVKEQIEELNKVLPWDGSSDINEWTETGVYHFAGYRMTTGDHLPIDNAGEKNNISFTLIVDKSEGKFFESEQYHLKSGVAQTIIIDNNAGGDTKIFTRHGTITVAGASPEDIGVVTWEAHWQELVGSTYLGVIRHDGGYGLDGYNANEVLRGCTENGLYTGAFMAPPQIFDVFKLEVMNNYAMAHVYNTGNTVLQTLTILSVLPIESNGAHATLQRKGTWDGSSYDWTEWESQSFEVPTATQTTLGIVKGSSTVEVREDGSLQVNSDRLESAIADKLGVIKQGRNTLIDASGAINVDGISNTEADTDFSDGEINDIRVQIEPTKTIEELRYERADVYEEGYSGFEAITENIPNLYPGQYDRSLVGNTANAGEETIDLIDYKEPGIEFFEETKGSSYSSWSATTDSFRNIWATAANEAKKRISTLKGEGYGDENNGTSIGLRTGFGQQPYMMGRFVFVITQNLDRFCSASHFLYNAKGECLGKFGDGSNYKERILPIESPRLDGSFDKIEDYLPLRIETQFYKTEVAPTSGDFDLSLKIYTEEITNNIKDWSNPTINDKGRTFLLFAEKYVEYPMELKTADLTRCLSIGKNGILFQSAVKSGTAKAITITEKELFIKFDESGNIITNIGDFIN
jgi:hypothetical protein